MEEEGPGHDDERSGADPCRRRDAGFCGAGFRGRVFRTRGLESLCHAGRRGLGGSGGEAFDVFEALGRGEGAAEAGPLHAQEFGGDAAPVSQVSSITTGALKGPPSARRWVGSKTGFHPRRNQPGGARLGVM